MFIKALVIMKMPLEHYKEALTITRDIGNKSGEGINLGNLGDLLMLVHRWEEAERYLILAIEICGRTTPAAQEPLWAHWLGSMPNSPKLSKPEKLLVEGRTVGRRVSRRTRKVLL